MESSSIFLVFFLCSFSWFSESNGAPTAPSDQAKALSFMRKFGYIEGSGYLQDRLAAQPLLGNVTMENFKEAIKEVQRFGDIEMTGELDEKTLELMSAKRCGVPDVIEDSSVNTAINDDLPSKDEMHHHENHHHHHHQHHHHHRRKRFILANRGWNRRHITYYLTNWPENLNRDEVQDVMKKALDTWGYYGNLKFTQVSYPKDGDIVLGFYKRQHGDPFAFDGPGLVLAHAFSPSRTYQDEKGLDGDVHFDGDEKWVVNSKPRGGGVDLMATALHELGHSLGLSHSPDRDSVMYAYYKEGNNKLGYDDILAMHELYIKRHLDDGDEYTPPRRALPSPTARTTSTTTSSTTVRYEETTTKKKHLQFHGTKSPDGCNGAFDSVAFIRGELFIIKKKMMWRLREPGVVQKDYPTEFKRMFALPDYVKKIDAMYERQTDSGVVIFSGSQYWISDGNSISSPRPVTDYGLPWKTVKVDAVTVRNGSTYIFSDLHYWTYDDQQKILVNSSRPLTDWGFPPRSSASIDSVMTYKDGNTYFFKGDHYWIYNGRLSAPRKGPKSASQFWLSC